MIFELDGKRYSNEQEIIEAGVGVIYYYCCNVNGRWIYIEHLMVENEWWGYWYADDMIRGRYEPELETLYLMRHGRHWVDSYTRRNLLRYGNV